MVKCEYDYRNPMITLKCSLDALPEEKYCYWHQEAKGKNPTQEQLEELKKPHFNYIVHPKPFLVDANLQKANLDRADLQEANLSGANLQEANLVDANLQEANLVDANLQEANLVNAYLQKANLDRADLQKANLVDANLQKANLVDANLQEANLVNAYLQKANLDRADLQKANLVDANLQEADLVNANLQEANLVNANLQKANISGANLQEANLSGANLQEANLVDANLQGTNLYRTKVEPKTVLDDSKMIGANLSHSYFDETKSFRNVKVFLDEDGKEINEIVGDFHDDGFAGFLERFKKYSVKLLSKITSLKSRTYLRKKLDIPFPLRLPSSSKWYVLDFSKIPKNVFGNLNARGGLIRYVGKGDKIIFFDINSKSLIKNPENERQHKGRLVKVEGLSDLILKDGKIQSDYLYKGSSASLYEASYEIYNNLYNFYIANGRLDMSAHVHYRREEVHRKLRWKKGGRSKLRSIFDLVILRSLTGYGDKINRPIIFSGSVIGIFAILFKLTDGITKTVILKGDVNGIVVEPDLVDYFYHSITTFTSLGYSNIQPNLANGHLPQYLVAVESGLGVMMMALIIFVITYQVSR